MEEVEDVSGLGGGEFAVGAVGEIGDNFGFIRELRGNLVKFFEGNSLDIRNGGGASGGIELDAVGIDAGDAVGEVFEFGGIGVNSFYNKDFQPILSFEFLAELDEAGEHFVEGDVWVGAVDFLEGGGGAGVEGGGDEVGAPKCLSYMRLPEEGAVGENGDGDVGEGFDLVDEFGEGGVEGGFAGAGEGDVVGLGVEFGLKFFDNSG